MAVHGLILTNYCNLELHIHHFKLSPTLSGRPQHKTDSCIVAYGTSGLSKQVKPDLDRCSVDHGLQLLGGDCVLLSNKVPCHSSSYAVGDLASLR